MRKGTKEIYEGTEKDLDFLLLLLLFNLTFSTKEYGFNIVQLRDGQIDGHRLLLDGVFCVLTNDLIVSPMAATSHSSYSFIRVNNENS